jgi:hypothetical protein
MKCKKEEQQGGAGRGARRGKKTCEESLMGRTGQKKIWPKPEKLSHPRLIRTPNHPNRPINRTTHH